MSAGFDPERFWLNTMKEVDREMRGAAKGRERRTAELIFLAWHVVAFDRTKKLPNLQDVLSKAVPEKRRQTGEEMLAAMKGIFLAFGGDAAELEGTNDQRG